MVDGLKDLEYFSSIHHCYLIGDIIDIDDEDNYVMKNKKDNTEEIYEPKNIRKITNISSIPLNESICEYIRNEGEYLEGEIKETKGQFCILEIDDEEGNQSTILSRKKQLRYIEFLLLEDFIREKFANIRFSITPELSEWIGSDRFKSIINKIIGNNENSKLFYTHYPSEAPKYLRILCDTNHFERAKLLFSTAIEHEKKLISLNQDTEKYKNELNNVKKKNQKVYVSQKHIGLIIGKDGTNIKSLKNKYGVNITIDSKNNKKLAQVIIKGENGDKVEECAKEINICEKIFEIKENRIVDLKKRANQIIEDYKLRYFYISNEEKKDEDGHTDKAPNLSVIGNSENIDEFYNNEIIRGNDSYENYNNYSNYDNYKNYNNYGNNGYYTSSTYRQNNRRHNNYNNNYYNNYNSNSYKYNKSYSNNYYK